MGDEMDLEKSATRAIKKFDRLKVWKKLYGILASEWVSIREASLQVDRPEDKRGYTLNESVRRCIKQLKSEKFLEVAEKEKIKKSSTPDGKERNYTSTSTRYRLDVVSLWTDFLTEKFSLNSQEKVIIEKFVRNKVIKRVVREEKPSRMLKIFKSQFSIISDLSIPNFLGFIKKLAKLQEFNDNIGFEELLDLSPEKSYGIPYEITSEFFESVRNEYASGELSKYFEKGPQEFEVKLKQILQDIIKNRLETKARKQFSENIDSQTVKRFVNEFLKVVLRNKPTSIKLSEKIASSADISIS